MTQKKAGGQTPAKATIRTETTEPQDLNLGEAFSGSSAIDLFSWAKENISKTHKQRVQDCLRCEKEKMVLEFNPNSNRYEGFRICKPCRGAINRRVKHL